METFAGEAGDVYEEFGNRLPEESEKGGPGGRGEEEDHGEGGHVELGPFGPKMPSGFCEGRGA